MYFGMVIMKIAKYLLKLYSAIKVFIMPFTPSWSLCPTSISTDKGKMHWMLQKEEKFPKHLTNATLGHHNLAEIMIILLFLDKINLKVTTDSST